MTKRIARPDFFIGAALSLSILLAPMTARAADMIVCPGLGFGPCYLASGFSGAVLASQALTSLAQTSTQTSVESALGKVDERRHRATEACAPGFRRLDGECRRSPPLASHGVVAVPKSGPTKADGRAGRPATRRPSGATTPAGIEPTTPEMEDARGLLFGAPVPILPDTAFGAWVDGFGDFERRNANGAVHVFAETPVSKNIVPMRVTAQSASTSYGLQLGLDFTTRGVLRPTDGLIAGLLLGGMRTDFELKTLALSSDFSLVGHGSSRMQASLAGGGGGVYLTYFDGPFSADLIAKADALVLDAHFSDIVAFESKLDARAPVAALSLVDVNLAGEVNYRFPISAHSWVEPTLGAHYTTTMYDERGAHMGFADGEQVRVQGGARLGHSFRLGSTPTTLTVTGVAYDDVLVSGGFMGDKAIAGSDLLARSNEGKPRGRGIIAFAFDHGDGISSFIQAEARGGSELFGGGGKVGVRISW